MFRNLVVSFIILNINTIYAQSGFKDNSYFSFNLLTGYQSFPAAHDLNAKLEANNFTSVFVSHLALGFETTIAAKQNVFKFQIQGTNGFIKRNARPTKLQSTALALLYGRDILLKSERTYIYPFVGFRLFGLNLLGQSIDGKRLNTYKDDYHLLFGLGLKQMLNYNLRGMFYNLDLNAGFSLPVINGKWVKEGSLYVIETYQNRPTFYFILTIGKGRDLVR